MTTAAFRMRPWAMVEITSTLQDDARVELIRAAYRWSRSGLVALALRGVSRQSVDRVLDQVVDVRRERRHGVVYLDATHLGQPVLDAAGHAAVVVASTPEFHGALRKRGIHAVLFTAGLSSQSRLSEREAANA